MKERDGNKGGRGTALEREGGKEGRKEGRKEGGKEGREEGREEGRPELIPQMRTISDPPGQLTGGIINPRPNQRSLFTTWQPLLECVIIHCQNHNLSQFF